MPKTLMPITPNTGIRQRLPHTCAETEAYTGRGTPYTNIKIFLLAILRLSGSLIKHRVNEIGKEERQEIRGKKMTP